MLTVKDIPYVYFNIITTGVSSKAIYVKWKLLFYKQHKFLLCLKQLNINVLSRYIINGSRLEERINKQMCLLY